MMKLLLLVAILANVSLLVSSDSCGANETYVDCPDAQCVPKCCSDLGNPLNCPDQPKDGSCSGDPGCVCIDGFVRDDNDVCIPSSDCPSCGGDVNKRAGCGVYCNRHCSDIGEEPKACIAICYSNACDCREGYYLNSDGKCVKPDQCNTTSCGGDPNAKSGCGVNCGKRCSTYQIKNPKCPHVCHVNGCDCKDGYVYDDNLGKCVKPKECTPTCQVNEVFSNCTNGGCDARNCSQLGNPVPCVKLDPASCKKGCVCIDGYLRAANGKCVPKSECPSCGGDPNAKSGCGVNCGKRCSTYQIKNPICPKICNVNGCDCKDGYVYDENLGKCVKPKECTPTCQVNEVFSNCTNGGCDARNCRQLGNPVPCVKLDPASCKKGCVCIDGYLRAANGKCVPKSQCPSCGGDPNAKSGCGVYCGKRCSTYQIKNPACSDVCNVNGCDCKDGYVYDDNLGKCVKPKECTPTCQVNEVFSNCTNGGCDARNCSQLGNPVPCVKLDPASCKKGCVCIDGYLRAANGKCVPKSECPSCGGDPNAESGCGVNCGKRCSTYQIKNPACSDVCNVNGCDCKDGYVYDDYLGKCVKPKECTPTCQVNEVFSNCTNGGCDARNCSQLGNPVPCVKLDPASCKKGCVCKDGYLRAANGKCVPKSECPSCGGDPNAESGCGVNCGKRCSTYQIKNPACSDVCNVNGCDCKDGYVYDDNLGKCVKPKECTPTCQVNEVFSNCTNGGCDARNCSQLGNPVPCVKLDPASCKKGCVCIDGYLRAANGKCVPKSQCPSCGGDPNAKSGCGVNCGKRCSTYQSKNPICPRICNVNGCDCKDGYVYDDNLGKCVKPKECTPTCQVNEVFSNCTNSGCDARNCSQLGFPVPCVDVDSASCKKGCVCQQNYLRAKNGTCIPRNECPSCGGDPNAKSGCGVHCGNTCSTYKNKPVPCPLICLVNGCDCKQNYVYDTNTKKCVLPKDCTKSPDTTTTTLKPTTTTTLTTSSTGQCSDEDAQECLTAGNIDFTVNFLYQMIKLNSGKSIVMSPISVFIPIAELAMNTEPGDSYNQLMTALNLNSKEQIRTVFPALLTSLKSQTNALLDLAAKIYVSQDAELTENFENDSLQLFGAKAENVDFSDSQKAADIINAWVEEVTNGLIQDLVSPSMFSAYTRLVLVNAIYFLGNWQTQFNPVNTQTEDFYVTADNSVEVPMMYRKGSFRFAESSNLDCKILEIPYKNDNFSYVIFLPNQIDGYSGLAQKLRDPAVLNQALDSLSYQTCLLYLPRHDISSSIDLTNILASLNITGIFDPNTANLSGILEGSEKLSVSSAVQKAKINVTEVGTEAAAANAVVVGVTSVIVEETIYTVKADHPFLFFLLLQKDPLFCGVYAGN